MNIQRWDRERLFERIFQEGNVGIALVGLDFTFLEVNPRLCEITGYSSEELRDRKFIDITHPDDIHTDVQLADQLFRGMRKNYQIEKRYFKKNGEIVWIYLSASVIRNEADEPLFALSMITDITAIKNSENGGAPAVPHNPYRELPESEPAETFGDFLNVCSWCTKVRGTDSRWHRFEDWIKKTFQVSTTHGICPGCEAKQRNL